MDFHYFPLKIYLKSKKPMNFHNPYKHRLKINENPYKHRLKINENHWTKPLKL